MKKSDLQNGMIVKRRDGLISVVINKAFHHCSGAVPFEYYNEDLTSTRLKGCDITKVGMSCFASYIKKLAKREYHSWIWERKEYELTSDETDFLILIDDNAETFNIQKVRNKLDGKKIVIRVFDNFGQEVVWMETGLMEFKGLKTNRNYDIKEVLNNSIIKENDND